MAPEHEGPERAQRVADLLRTAAQSERAPDALQGRISAMQARAAAAPSRSLLPRPTLNLIRFGMPAAAAGAAALVIALGGAAGAPTLAQAAALATRVPTQPAPATDPGDPSKFLTAKVGALRFPNWRAAGGWRAVGERVDQLGDRRATTVYYKAGTRTVAYSIVSSPTLKSTAGLEPPATPMQYYRTMLRDGRTTVVWTELDHTCLLTGPRGMTATELWSLAARGFSDTLNP